MLAHPASAQSSDEIAAGLRAARKEGRRRDEE
jgi:hypothetical protein